MYYTDKIIENCEYCKEIKKREITFYPEHFAKPWCRSGKKEHCTCDSCF